MLVKSKKTFNIKPTHSLKEIKVLNQLFPNKIQLLLTKQNNIVVGGSLVFFVNSKTCLVFYNAIDQKLRNSQLSSLQLYSCMNRAKQNNCHFIDFGVSHNPASTNPYNPKFSLIQFKEQFGARGVVRIIFKKDFSVDE